MNEPKPFVPNKFVNTDKGKGRPRAGLPYRIQNGNYGVYLPKHFFGMMTAGYKMIIDLRTKNTKEALERIEAIGLWVRLATCKKETF